MTTVRDPRIPTRTHSHPNVTTLAAIYADLTAIGAHVTDEVVLHTADRPSRTVVGREAVVAHERRLVDLGGDGFTMEVQEISANDHFGSVLGVLRTSGDGSIAMPFCGLWRFRDGRIVEHWENAAEPDALAQHLTGHESGSSDPQPIMDLVTGFWAAQVLVTAHELGLFTWLAGTPGTTVSECATHLEIEHRPAELLLTACAALGLLNRTTDGRYHNSTLADAFLVPGRPRYFGGWVTMAARREYPAWMRLADAVRTNRPVTWDPDQRQSLFDSGDSLLTSTFWEAMHALSATTSEAVADVVDLSGATSLLDVGGGSAAYDITLCRRHPRLSATVLDLPFVCDLAAEKIDQADLGDRITLVHGDFLTSELPTGHDTILLSGILHDWNEEDCRLIVDRCLRALRPGGRLFVVDLMVNDTKDGPPDAALMSVNMLIETWGRSYTAAEYSTWLTDAGFVDVHTVRCTAPAANGVVIGHKAMNDMPSLRTGGAAKNPRPPHHDASC